LVVGALVVGASVGAAVGLAVVGASVGLLVGFLVVGASVGAAVGLAVVGALVVGALVVGEVVGSLVGEDGGLELPSVGPSVGHSVGHAVGLRVGALVFAGVGQPAGTGGYVGSLVGVPVVGSLVGLTVVGSLVGSTVVGSMVGLTAVGAVLGAEVGLPVTTIGADGAGAELDGAVVGESERVGAPVAVLAAARFGSGAVPFVELSWETPATIPATSPTATRARTILLRLACGLGGIAYVPAGGLSAIGAVRLPWLAWLSRFAILPRVALRKCLSAGRAACSCRCCGAVAAVVARLLQCDRCRSHL
jgi:hypothetical protein